MIRPIRIIRRRVQLSLAEALHRLRGESGAGDAPPAVECAVLEPRVLMSASPAAVAAPEPAMIEAAGQIPDSAPAETADPPPSSDDGSHLQQQPAVELIVVDSRTRDYEQLVEGIVEQQDRKFELLILDRDVDGVGEISQAISDLGNVAAVHLVSHSSDGQLRLGNSVLNRDTLGHYQGDWAVWREGLQTDADLLIYGCNVAASESGESFLGLLAESIQADVAASSDLTGDALQGGDWDLEYQLGQVDTELAFSLRTQQEWEGLLATLTVNQTADVINGDVSSVAALLANDGGDGISLREAVIAANSHSGVDTIVLQAGTYTLSRQGADDTAMRGDLDIVRDLILEGAGAGTTVISAGGLGGGGSNSDRVFDIQNGAEVSIAGVTITGGHDRQGSGIHVDDNSELLLTESIVTGNNSLGEKGGGIFNASGSTVVLRDVTVSNNSAGNDAGGGIRNEGNMTLDRVTLSGNSAYNGGAISSRTSSSELLIVNSTISGNTASNDGGGIESNRTVKIYGSTIAFNTAADDGAGIHNSGSSISIISSILAYNTDSRNTVGNVSGSPLNSLGFNIDSDNTAGLSGTGDQSGVDPLLSSSLTHNGGFAATHALQATSAAIGAGTSISETSGLDQRGMLRDGSPDVGAYEANAGLLSAISDFRVNSTTTDEQHTAGAARGSQQAVAMLGSGRYVVVWTDSAQDGSGSDVYARIYNADGSAHSGEIRVNHTVADEQKWARVAADDLGNFVVTWTSENQDGTDSSVYARRFNSSGTALANEFRVNSSSSGAQADASLAMNGAGDFVIAWSGSGSGDSNGIFARRYQANGQALGSEFRVNVDTSDQQTAPSVAINSSGRFVIAWDDGPGIRARTFEANGTSAKEWSVDASSTAEVPDVALNDEGEVFVVWQREISFFGRGVYGRVFNFNGDTLTAEYVVNSLVTGHQQNPSISLGVDDTYIVAWEGSGTGDSDGVFFQKYSSAGVRNGSETRINSQISGSQADVSLAVLNSDHFVAVWSGSGSGDTDGVFARQYGTETTTNQAPVADSGGPYTIAEGDSLRLDGSGSTDPDADTLTWSWDLDNDGLYDDATGSSPLLNWAQLPLEIQNDGTYTIGVQVSDGQGGSDTATTTLTVTNEDPEFTSPTTVNVAEGSTLVQTLTATDPADDLTFTIIGGDDQARFAVDAVTGVLTFATAPDFEVPTDSNTNNVYVVQVQVSDGDGGTDTQTVQVTVLDVNDEAPVATGENYTLSEGGTLAGRTAGNWFNQAWTKRQELVMDNSDQTGDIQDLPVLVRLHESANDAIQIDYADTQNAGQDLRFVDGDGTVLDHEIARWDETGYSYVWVRVPRVDGGSSTDSFHMYYGNPTAPNGASTSAVWASEKVVAHLDGNGTDSAGGDNSGSPSTGFSTAGVVGPAASLNGTSGAVNFGRSGNINDLFFGDGGGSISVWIKPSDWGENGFGRIADKADTTFGPNGSGWTLHVAELLSGDGSEGYLLFEQGFHGGVNGEWRTPPQSIRLDEWQHIVVTYDSSSSNNTPRIFINGVEQTVTQTLTPLGVAITDSHQDLKVGNFSDADSRTFDGLIDEFRFAEGQYSADRVAAEYLMVTGGFLSSTGVETDRHNVLANDTDADSTNLTVSIVSGPAHATTFILNTDGTFQYTHDGSETTVDSFVYEVSDGVNTAQATATLNVTPVNDHVPVIAPGQSFQVADNATNGTVVGTISASDGDAGSVLSNWTITGGNGSGIFALNTATGQVTVANPSALQNSPDATHVLQVRVSDGTLQSTVRSITINVLQMNDAPVLTPAAPAWTPTTEDATSSAMTVASILAGTVTDADTGALQGMALTGTHGNGDWQYSLNGGATWQSVGTVTESRALLLRSTDQLRYVPDQLNGETARLRYRAWDQTGATSGQQGHHADISVLGTGGLTAFSTADDVATLSVEARADLPQVSNASTVEDTQTTSGLVITPAAGDQDVSHFRISGISHGTVFLQDGVTQVHDGDFITVQQGLAGLKFTPDAGYFGTAGFQVQASVTGDLTDLSSVAQASVLVAPQADTPVVTSTSTPENSQTTGGLVITRNATDGAEVTHFKISGITNGRLFLADGVTEVQNDEFITVAQGADGLKFTPDADFFGTGGFLVHASTSPSIDGISAPPATATVTVTSTNQTPTASPLPDYTGQEDDDQARLRVADFFEDPDGDTLTYSLTIIEETPDVFTRLKINPTAGIIQVRSAPNLSGTALVRVTATDPEGFSVSREMRITIEPVNDAPKVSNQQFILPGSGVLEVSAPGLLDGASDVDGDAITIVLLSAPDNGELTVNPDGSFSWTPAQGFSGSFTFMFAATDGTLTSAPAMAMVKQAGGQVVSGAVGAAAAVTTDSGQENRTDQGNESGSTEADTASDGIGNDVGSEALQAAGSSGESETGTQSLVGAPAAEADSEEDGAALNLLLQQHADLSGSDHTGMIQTSTADGLRVATNGLGLLPGSSAASRGSLSAQQSLLASRLESTLLENRFYDQIAQDTSQFAQTLNLFERSIAQELKFDRAVVGSVTAVSSGLAVGSVIWAVRGGLLLSGLLAQMPVWTMVDPLLVIDGVGGKDEDEGDSIQDIVDGQQDADDSRPASEDAS